MFEIPDVPETVNSCNWKAPAKPLGYIFAALFRKVSNMSNSAM